MTSLPPAFAALLPFTGWALATETERNHKRIATPQADIAAFAQAMTPRLADIAAYLNGFPLEAMPEDARHLFHMLLSVAEISPCVEFYQSPTVTEGFDSMRFQAQEDHPRRPHA
jgi:hypothetical protein